MRAERHYYTDTTRTSTPGVRTQFHVNTFLSTVEGPVSSVQLSERVF